MKFVSAASLVVLLAVAGGLAGGLGTYWLDARGVAGRVAEESEWGSAAIFGLLAGVILALGILVFADRLPRGQREASSRE